VHYGLRSLRFFRGTVRLDTSRSICTFHFWPTTRVAVTFASRRRNTRMQGNVPFRVLAKKFGVFGSPTDCAPEYDYECSFPGMQEDNPEMNTRDDDRHRRAISGF
jgi:hypothetical protein